MLIAYLESLTIKQLNRLGWNVYGRACDSYGVSSFDWPTLRAVYPEHARIMSAIITVMKRKKVINSV